MTTDTQPVPPDSPEPNVGAEEPVAAIDAAVAAEAGAPAQAVVAEPFLAEAETAPEAAVAAETPGEPGKPEPSEAPEAAVAAEAPAEPVATEPGVVEAEAVEPEPAEAEVASSEAPEIEAPAEGDFGEAEAGEPTPAMPFEEPAVAPAAVLEAPAPPRAAPRTAARFIADALAAAGVRVAFTVPGESFLPLLDALPAVGIRVVAARHEGGASFMAAGAAALTGRPVALLATRAVGAANMAIGLHTAFADSAPVIALVGQVRRPARGREAFQEIDLPATIGRLCRWATEVRDVAALPGAVDEALRRATTARPGPVLLSLPEDLLVEDVPASARVPSASSALGPPRSPGPDPTTARRIMHLLLDAERPVILAGAGVLRSRGTADLVKLAELVDVPVMAAWRRPDVFPNDHALYLGMTGYWAAPTVRERLAAADAVLVVGCRLNEVASFEWSIPATGARWAHVDLEPLGARPGLGGPTIALSADARTFLREARRVLNGSLLHYEALTRRRAANTADRSAYEAARRVDDVPWDGPGVHPGRVIATLNAVLAPDAIVTTDAGHFAGWGARGLVSRRPGTYIGPTSGAMGFGIPAAIAASLANPGRPVVALAGDGGAGMTIAELETAVRERAHPVVLVFDNERYGTIRDDQDRRGYRPVATDLGQVDWAAAARSLGAEGVRVDDDDAFEPALRDALASTLPTLIHLPIDRRWVSVDHLEPPTVRPEPDVSADVSAPGAEPDAGIADAGVEQAGGADVELAAGADLEPAAESEDASPSPQPDLESEGEAPA